MEYRDGIKSKGDKIGMHCAHSTVIQNTCIPAQSTTQALYCRNKRPRNCTITIKIVRVCRDKSLGGIHKHVSVMLNIKLTLSGGGGLVCDSCRMTKVHVAMFTVKSYCYCFYLSIQLCLLVIHTVVTHSRTVVHVTYYTVNVAVLAGRESRRMHACNTAS